MTKSTIQQRFQVLFKVLRWSVFKDFCVLGQFSVRMGDGKLRAQIDTHTEKSLETPVEIV